MRRLLRWLLGVIDTIDFGPWHPDCDRSCARGLCHWCLRAAPVTMRIRDGHNRHDHLACRAHVSARLNRAMNIGQMYDDQAKGPAVLRER